MTSANGQVEFQSLVPGAYLIAADLGRANASTRVFIDLKDTDALGVRVQLRAQVDMVGRVQTESRTVPPDLTRLAVKLSARDGSQQLGTRAPVQADGGFALKSLAPTLFQVSLSGLPAGWFVKAATIGGADVLSSGLEPNERIPLEITLSDQAATVICEVVDGSQRPATIATVALIPLQRERSDLYRKMETDEQGTARFAGVAPGQYRIFIWERLEEGAWRDPRVLAQSDQNASMINVSANQQYTRSLKLP
jgi:hypothetical protein